MTGAAVQPVQLEGYYLTTDGVELWLRHFCGWCTGIPCSKIFVPIVDYGAALPVAIQTALGHKCRVIVK